MALNYDLTKLNYRFAPACFAESFQAIMVSRILTTPSQRNSMGWSKYANQMQVCSAVLAGAI
ncbi:MAG: hypothetical protein A2504_00405 [Bdellovibrionales bacterium RIFOXYD12_FULL_39_22]|nr:MAG: hypothetical protein A2385_13985 [Bdellovibrionales bacterium RIFOXYB1_FULL_39_21]OFZ42442.1 MAG: hypothetical protein A2485_04035 [Bdellovibrionales bacterium RIFOXYC12_FULL_39_17]OFZ45418.1 MAG: hypothetical protein A2404_01475 [Bdellovibrionales bacterium RIFOXYC1_FULL_39_130]OFZ68422.1 MAG: hypothetical protein A2451_01570 [Bdellovibrionales bacterium RIFOXYC2_FULL_39_8]OFZ74615.1 MAG: hypothetical protein A2560_09505 [Bdellovibrionales bacterium RIFOXYD1_FULL_39_84]OFZ92897.1 MAG: